jgi:cysteinyl-tRNA synthetase
MLRLFNTFGKRIETFEPLHKDLVSVFTCGPSVYQRSHIGNFRTFLFEDILVRYLEYLGYHVKRGMNFTDVEDKAIQEAARQGVSVKVLTDQNIAIFLKEMQGLRMKTPDFLPRASKAVDRAVEIIKHLLDEKIAYWHRGNCYFDPLRYPRFGELFGLDMKKWPVQKKRFHKDTYPGMQWNRGDFIIWHGYKKGEDTFWDTTIGKGRPAWNIQDPSMISQYFDETLSIYCGGIDNLFRHHDYTRAILESIRPYPMARYWLHCLHLRVNGKKMSKSIGNILYADTLEQRGYNLIEIRLFLIYGHYRKTMHYTDKRMHAVADRLRRFREVVKKIERAAGNVADTETGAAQQIEQTFRERMNDDLDVKGAFDKVTALVNGMAMRNLTATTAAGIIKALRRVDDVLRVIF